MKTSKTAITLLFALIVISMTTIGCDAQGRKNAKTAGSTPVKQAPEPANGQRLLGKNLIVNGDAEAPDSNAWHSDELKTIVYGEFGGGPMKDSPGPANRGEKYFYAYITRQKPVNSFSQKFDVKDLGGAIDKGFIQFDAGGWFGGSSHFTVNRLIFIFTGEGGKEVGTVTTDRKDNSDRQNDLDLVERTAHGSVPAGTRGIEVRLEFYLSDSVMDENVETLGYADNITFTLSQVRAAE